jgi:hypothetical protein
MNLSMRVGLFLVIASMVVALVGIVAVVVLFAAGSAATITPIAFAMNGALVVGVIGALLFGKGSLF